MLRAMYRRLAPETIRRPLWEARQTVVRSRAVRNSRYARARFVGHYPVPFAAARDTLNRVHYGEHAPRFAELIWVDPRECQVCPTWIGSYRSGEVVRGEWDLGARPLHEHTTVQWCRQRFELGMSWEQTGAYAHMRRLIRESGRARDGCITDADIIARYERLDALFRQVQEEGRLRPRSELDDDAFRELGGVLIHIGRDCRPLLGCSGGHRLGVALSANLPLIPASIGVVHRQALSDWHQRHRAESDRA